MRSPTGSASEGSSARGGQAPAVQLQVGPVGKQQPPGAGRRGAGRGCQPKATGTGRPPGAQVDSDAPRGRRPRRAGGNQTRRSSGQAPKSSLARPVRRPAVQQSRQPGGQPGCGSPPGRQVEAVQVDSTPAARTRTRAAGWRRAGQAGDVPVPRSRATPRGQGQQLLAPVAQARPEQPQPGQEGRLQLTDDSPPADAGRPHCRGPGVGPLRSLTGRELLVTAEFLAIAEQRASRAKSASPREENRSYRGW